MTGAALVPPILIAGLISASFKTKKSDRTLTGTMLEMEILSQCGESTLRDFKPSSMNHGKGSLIVQLTPIELNRLTVLETVSIDEPAGGHMEMKAYSNSARGHLIALENKNDMKSYLEEIIKGTTRKHITYGTLVFLEMHTQIMDQLVRLQRSAVILRHFEQEMQTIPKIHALIAIPYV